MKLGGDKGGETFKLSFQIANLDCPNSCKNTVFWSMFKAPDTYGNVKLVMQRYQSRIEELKNTKWRYIFSNFNKFKKLKTAA